MDFGCAVRHKKILGFIHVLRCVIFVILPVLEWMVFVESSSARFLGEASSQRQVVASTTSSKHLTKHAQQLFASLPPEVRSDVTGNLARTIETERSIRQWKLSAQKVNLSKILFTSIYCQENNVH